MMLAFGIGFEFPILPDLPADGGDPQRGVAQETPGASRSSASASSSAVITPSGDPISMLMLSVPMVLFYEISILVRAGCSRAARRPPPRQRDGHPGRAPRWLRVRPGRVSRVPGHRRAGRRPVGAGRGPHRVGQDRRRGVRGRQGARRGRQRRSTPRPSRRCRTRSTRDLFPPPRVAPGGPPHRGTNAINGDAPIVVMTTEGAPQHDLREARRALAQLRYVVLDEVPLPPGRVPAGRSGRRSSSTSTLRCGLVCLFGHGVQRRGAGRVAHHRPRADRGAVIEEKKRPGRAARTSTASATRSSQELHLLPTLVDARPNPEADRLDDEALHARGGRSGAARPRPPLLHATPAGGGWSGSRTRGMLPAITFQSSVGRACDEARDACLDAGLPPHHARRASPDPGHRRRAHRQPGRRRPRRARLRPVPRRARGRGGRPPRGHGASVQGDGRGLLHRGPDEGRVRHRDPSPSA